MMKRKTKANIVLAVISVAMLAITALLIYAVYCDITNPRPKPQHGSYAHCEYRVAKGACGKWVTKNY